MYILPTGTAGLSDQYGIMTSQNDDPSNQLGNESSFTSESAEEDPGHDSSIIPNPYQFSDRPFNFGFEKKGTFLQKSDFGLKLTEFVEAGNLTGYYCEVTHEITGETRYSTYHSYCLHMHVYSSYAVTS